MKKDLKMHPGFTIAELLISMLIVMLVASAMVPIVGPKKLRTLTTRFNHGIAACYWDADGRLMYLLADNGANRNASPTPMGEGATSCRFNVPRANHYTIYAIGAGADGAGNDGNGLSSTVAPQTLYNGTISLENFRNNIEEGVTRAVNGEALNLIPNQQPVRGFALEVQDVFTDWARSINAGRELSHEEAQGFNVNPNGRYLYAAFTGLTGPTGAGGAGYAGMRTLGIDRSPQCANVNNFTNELLQAFFNNTQGALYRIGPINNPFRYKYKDEDNYVAESVAIEQATDNRKCFFFLHSAGGNSAQPIKINSNNPVLFPIDGSSAVTINPGAAYYYEPHFNGNNVSDTQNREADRRHEGALAETVITVTGTDFDNTLQLQSSAPGGNGGPAGDGRDGNNGLLFGRCAYTPQPANGLQVRYSGQNLNCDRDFTRGTANNGTPSGPVNPQSAGFNFPNPRHGSAGVINYRTGDAFSWQYQAPWVRGLRYGTAGQHGEPKQMAFANLTGVLTLVPGINNNNGFSDTRVLNGDNEVIMLAHSFNQAGGIRTAEDYSIRDEGGDTPRIPPERVRNLTMPNNDEVFGAFLNQVRSINFDNRNNNGLAHCGEAGRMACPGYAGSGAYPVITADIIYRLILRNNQNYPMNALERQFTRNYEAAPPFNQDDSTNCPDGLTLIRPQNGVPYCTEQGASRGDGAVVIIW